VYDRMLSDLKCTYNDGVAAFFITRSKGNRLKKLRILRHGKINKILLLLASYQDETYLLILWLSLLAISATNSYNRVL
jgi:hypothetical protein